jgi:hypothetical protein
MPGAVPGKTRILPVKKMPLAIPGVRTVFALLVRPASVAIP